MYDVSDLFQTEILAQELTITDPMIASYKAGLAEIREKIDSAPHAAVNLFLPILVQTSPNLWEKWAIKRNDGSQVLIAIFIGYSTEYLQKSQDANVEYLIMMHYELKKAT